MKTTRIRTYAYMMYTYLYIYKYMYLLGNFDFVPTDLMISLPRRASLMDLALTKEFHSYYSVPYVCC